MNCSRYEGPINRKTAWMTQVYYYIAIIHSFTHSFIHSGHFYSAPSSPLLLRGACSRLQHGYCIGVSRRSAQATAGKGLAQGPYVAARAGVEPTTLGLKVIV